METQPPSPSSTSDRENHPPSLPTPDPDDNDHITFWTDPPQPNPPTSNPASNPASSTTPNPFTLLLHNYPQPQPREEEKKQPPPQAYLLEWTDPHPLTRKPTTTIRTPLPSPALLRAVLSRPPIPDIYLDKDDYLGDEARRLVVVHGLPREMVLAMEGEANPPSRERDRRRRDGIVLPGEEEERVDQVLGVDGEFVERFVKRRPYRPGSRLKQRAWRRRFLLSGRRGDGEEAVEERAEANRYVCGGYVWEYPEMVEFGEGGPDFEAGDGEEEMGDGPGVGVLGEDGGRTLGVVFCRAGLWLGERGSVLFLERDVWGDDAGARLRKARSRGVVGGEVDEEEVTASMEDVVLEALEEGWDPKDQLPGVIAEVVYHRWLELFDFLEPQPPVPCEETAACYQRILRSLELNDEGEDYMPWTKLISRMKYRIELLPALQDRLPALQENSPPPSTTPSRTTDRAPSPPNQTTAGQATTTKSSFPHRGQSRRPRRTDENQRALDRLSYLGGILIPLPIVSSILSMGDVYGPDGSRFFVFWALAVPLAGLTVLLIYADTIRKAEVWVEIGAEHVMPSPGGGGSESSNGEDTGPVDGGVKGGRPVAWRRQRVNGDEERPGDVPLVVDHDVEERIIGMPAAAAAASVQPEDEEVDWLPRRRWSMGWGQVPSVILERPVDGSKPKAWKREQLGWSGAIRTILYKKFRDGDDVPEGVAACEKRERRKTN